MAEQRKYADRAQYMINAVSKRRKKVREMAIKTLGSKCQICGYSRCQNALDFHHKDESAKSFGISAKGYTRSWEKIKKEIRKCYLLCANCHRAVHAGNMQLPQEIEDEKRGKLRETLAQNDYKQGNPQPSL